MTSTRIFHLPAAKNIHITEVRPWNCCSPTTKACIGPGRSTTSSVTLTTVAGYLFDITTRDLHEFDKRFVYVDKSDEAQLGSAKAYTQTRYFPKMLLG